ncbi:Dnajc2 [Symbiodinium necroappetens]|uniref:Dnajc2 protein n=1 Tax=Symbiodinium necroappetens TaxID=1628268 RepID=A0A812W8R1_9DINO|nr:Dnajc2 [Symbiodinium necroappetens]
MLAAPLDGGLQDTILCAPAAPRRRRVECAGKAFLEAFERPSPHFAAATAQAEQAEAEPKRDGRKVSKATQESNSLMPSRKQNAARRKPYLQRCAERAERRSKLLPNKVQLAKRLRGVELYTLLGVEVSEEVFPAEEAVREAYKKMVLIHHPDKNASKSLAFQLIQEAYEYISDRDNKQVYDSTLPFNDNLPTQEDVSRCGFFQALAPAFRRNAKWSERQPVPDLGGPHTPLESVHAFYNWWYHFESWRDVGPRYLEKHGLQLEDLQCCSREERRARQKQNEQIRKQFDAHERLRIMRLVDLAWQNDPRIEWEKAQGKPTSTQPKKIRSPTRKKVAVDPQAPWEKEAEELRRQREEAKKKAKSRRQTLRKLVESLGLLVSGVELERYSLKVEGDAEELEDLAFEVERLAALPAEDVLEEPRLCGTWSLGVSDR